MNNPINSFCGYILFLHDVYYKVEKFIYLFLSSSLSFLISCLCNLFILTIKESGEGMLFGQSMMPTRGTVKVTGAVTEALSVSSAGSRTTDSAGGKER